MKRGGWLYALCDVLIPRFTTEDFALVNMGDRYVIAFAMAYCDPDDECDGIATMRSFSWLGLGFFPKMVGEVRPFVNPHWARKP